MNNSFCFILALLLDTIPTAPSTSTSIATASSDHRPAVASFRLGLETTETRIVCNTIYNLSLAAFDIQCSMAKGVALNWTQALILPPLDPNAANGAGRHSPALACSGLGCTLCFHFTNFTCYSTSITSLLQVNLLNVSLVTDIDPEHPASVIIGDLGHRIILYATKRQAETPSRLRLLVLDSFGEQVFGPDPMDALMTDVDQADDLMKPTILTASINPFIYAISYMRMDSASQAEYMIAFMSTTTAGDFSILTLKADPMTLFGIFDPQTDLNYETALSRFNETFLVAANVFDLEGTGASMIQWVYIDFNRTEPFMLSYFIPIEMDLRWIDIAPVSDREVMISMAENFGNQDIYRLRYDVYNLTGDGGVLFKNPSTCSSILRSNENPKLLVSAMTGQISVFWTSNAYNNGDLSSINSTSFRISEITAHPEGKMCYCSPSARQLSLCSTCPQESLNLFIGSTCSPIPNIINGPSISPAIPPSTSNTPNMTPSTSISPPTANPPSAIAISPSDSRVPTPTNGTTSLEARIVAIAILFAIIRALFL